MTYITDLDDTAPVNTDKFSTCLTELRDIKQTLQNTLANITGAVNASHAELSYCDGVTSNIQAQLNALKLGKDLIAARGKVYLLLGASAGFAAEQNGMQMSVNEETGEWVVAFPSELYTNKVDEYWYSVNIFPTLNQQSDQIPVLHVKGRTYFSFAFYDLSDGSTTFGTGTRRLFTPRFYIHLHVQ